MLLQSSPEEDQSILVEMSVRSVLSGRQADLCDNTNPDWLPMLNLGHGKRETASSMANAERWE